MIDPVVSMMIHWRPTEEEVRQQLARSERENPLASLIEAADDALPVIGTVVEGRVDGRYSDEDLSNAYGNIMAAVRLIALAATQCSVEEVCVALDLAQQAGLRKLDEAQARLRADGKTV